MQILILAAGYATRLYPLTKNKPKPLLPVAGKPMLEHIVEKLRDLEGEHEFLIVTNEKFSGHFERWSEDYKNRNPKFSVRVINDHSTTDENKLGAIGDIHLVTQQVSIRKELLVIAGDNLFEKSLTPFVEYGRKKNAPVLAIYDVGDLEKIKKYSSITLDNDGKILSFVEKPKDPKTTLTGIALYYYTEQALRMLNAYIAEGNNQDQPGRFIQWLHTRTPVYTWRLTGRWFDIGSKESLELADNEFSVPAPAAAS